MRGRCGRSLLAAALVLAGSTASMADAHLEFGGMENATTVTFDPRRVTGNVTWRH